MYEYRGKSAAVLGYQCERDYNYSSSSNPHSTFLPPMFHKSSNFNIHGGTFIHASGGASSGMKDSKDRQTTLSNTQLYRYRYIIWK